MHYSGVPHQAAASADRQEGTSGTGVEAGMSLKVLLATAHWKRQTYTMVLRQCNCQFMCSQALFHALVTALAWITAGAVRAAAL